MGNTLLPLVFQPPHVTYNHDEHIIWLRTTKGSKIPSFHIDRKANITVLFSHGNAENLGMIYEYCLELTQALNVNVFAYDYEGYGKTRVKASEVGCYDDIDAAYSYLTNVLHTPPRKIVLHGRSLGSGPSCYLAERLSK